jgi:hypothetical protein
MAPVTTEFAPITAPAPIVEPGETIAFSPISTVADLDRSDVCDP